MTSDFHFLLKFSKFSEFLIFPEIKENSVVCNLGGQLIEFAVTSNSILIKFVELTGKK